MHEHTEHPEDHTEHEVGVIIGWHDPAEVLDDDIIDAEIVEPPPISDRWWKWRMWHDHDSDTWHAAQPFQLLRPYFRVETPWGHLRRRDVWGADAQAVLRRLQCAILIAESDQDHQERT